MRFDDVNRKGWIGGGRFVTLAKNRRSAFSVGQGRVLCRPMPWWRGVVATIRVIPVGGRARGRGGGIVFVFWGGGGGALVERVVEDICCLGLWSMMFAGEKEERRGEG